MWGIFVRHLRDAWSDDADDLRANGSCSEHKLRFVSLCSIFGGSARLHFRAENIHRHQQRSLSWPADKQWIDLYWIGFGICRCDAVFDLLGHLCQGAAAPCLYKTVHWRLNVLDFTIRNIIVLVYIWVIDHCICSWVCSFMWWM